MTKKYDLATALTKAAEDRTVDDKHVIHVARNRTPKMLIKSLEKTMGLIDLCNQLDIPVPSDALPKSMAILQGLTEAAQKDQS